MTEPVSNPDLAAARGPGQRPDLAGSPCRSEALLSDEDLLALLDGLGVAGTHDEYAGQEAVAAAEWAALLACGEVSLDAAASPATQVSPGGQGSPATQVSPGAQADADRRTDSRCPRAEYPGTASTTFLAGHLPAGPGLAGMLEATAAADASDWDLPGMAAGYRRLAAWAQARELAAVAEIATRRAAANPRIGADATGRPAQLPPEAAAEVALELRMTQPGASAWTDLGCQLRWQLPCTGAAFAAGTIDLGRARIIAEAASLLTDEHAALVEQRVLPNAAGQTTGQLRTAVRRAVLAVDPDGAEQRRKDTERQAKVSLYPGEQGTATLTGSSLPGLHAAAAMARITAMARALKASGASGGLDLLRAHIFVGLLLGTMPLIPPPADGPADTPPPDNTPPPDDDSGFGDPAGNGSMPGDDAQQGREPTSDSRPDSPSQPSDSRPDSPSQPSDSRPDSPSQPSDSLPQDRTPTGSPSQRVDDDGLRPLIPETPDDLPGWWPDIPCPSDADAPPDTGDPPDPAAVFVGQLDDFDEDWPQLPSPDWPVLPRHLPAVPETAVRGAADTTSARDDGAPTPPGLLDVLIPWSALVGGTCEPGFVGRIGPITSVQARQLLVLAARSPATQWRVVVTGDDGRAITVERVRPPAPTRTRATVADATGADATGADVTGLNWTGVVGRVTVSIRASALSAPAAEAAGAAGCPLILRDVGTAILAAARRAAARADAEAEFDARAGGCAHGAASAAYRPPPRIREFIAARDLTCRFATCGQPAWRTDIDHTIPWHRGGLTCLCNLGGCCRTHHRIKQLPGWHLEQPQPGTFRWTTPAGLSYHVKPDLYPV